MDTEVIEQNLVASHVFLDERIAQVERRIAQYREGLTALKTVADFSEWEARFPEFQGVLHTEAAALARLGISRTSLQESQLETLRRVLRQSISSYDMFLRELHRERAGFLHTYSIGIQQRGNNTTYRLCAEDGVVLLETTHFQEVRKRIKAIVQTHYSWIGKARGKWSVEEYQRYKEESVSIRYTIRCE